uniref:Bifunctional coenzyme A synthase n=1 Tax=Ciona intestinalis TaxID=7719 RepID=F6T7H6_CIOIN
QPMHRSGILVLTNHVSVLSYGDTVKRIVAGVKKIVDSTLYVHVENTCNVSQILNTHPSTSNTPRSFSSDIFPFISKFYEEAASQCEDLDVNILLHNIGQHSGRRYILSLLYITCRPIQCIITDHAENSNIESEIIRKFVLGQYALNEDSSSGSTIPILGIEEHSFVHNNVKSQSTMVTGKGNVVIGGTFDKIHSGHKVLLSEAALLANKRLLIGVTDGKMLERKTLHELIRGCETRISSVQAFLLDVHDFCIKEVVPILDPIGPASTDPDLQCIVVSKETERGGVVVNEARRKNNLNDLYVHVIGEGLLIGDESSSPTKETKLSSSTLRYKSLGTLRKSPNMRTLSHPPGAYVIGLTGGIASGKSSIAKRLQNLGAVVVDCDKLGHLAYSPGTKTFKKVVENFGSEVVSESGEIDRKILGTKIFGVDSKNRDLLNSIVWPEIERLARLKILEATSERKEKVICVLDAAVLLEAGWDNFCHEVWVSVVTRDEAIKRVVERDGRTIADTERRIQSQLSNKERVEKANVVLSTMWETSATQAQVEKAWSFLVERITKAGIIRH